MITRVCGLVNRVLDDEARLQVGPLEYSVLVPEFVRRQLQTQLGREVALHTQHYLEGSQMSNRLVPRLIGFLAESDLEFFELFCTVDKIGPKKALKALARPVADVAAAIRAGDAKTLTTLPGVGKASADQIVAALRHKVARFAVAAPEPSADGSVPPVAVNPHLLDEAYAALTALGVGPAEARGRLDRLLASGQSFGNVEEALRLVFQTGG